MELWTKILIPMAILMALAVFTFVLVICLWLPEPDTKTPAPLEMGLLDVTHRAVQVTATTDSEGQFPDVQNATALFTVPNDQRAMVTSVALSNTDTVNPTTKPVVVAAVHPDREGVVYLGRQNGASIAPLSSVGLAFFRFLFLEPGETLYMWARNLVVANVSVVFYKHGPERLTYTGVSPWKLTPPKGQRLLIHSMSPILADGQLHFGYNALAGGPHEYVARVGTRMLLEGNNADAPSTGEPVETARTLPIDVVPSGQTFEFSFDNQVGESNHVVSFSARYIKE